MGILASFYIWTHKLNGQAKLHCSIVPAEGGQAQDEQFDTHTHKVCMIRNYWRINPPCSNLGTFGKESLSSTGLIEAKACTRLETWMASQFIITAT